MIFGDEPVCAERPWSPAIAEQMSWSLCFWYVFDFLPRVKVVWAGGLPPFEGVIESVGTKYTMFSDKGFPVRATCNVKIKEASRASFKKGGS